MLPTGFARFPVWRRWFGQRSERAAAKYLRRQRFRILGRNIEDRLGEIDLLALDSQTLVVVDQWPFPLFDMNLFQAIGGHPGTVFGRWPTAEFVEPHWGRAYASASLPMTVAQAEALQLSGCPLFG